MRQVGLAGEAGAKQHRGLAGEARMGGEIRGVFASEIQSLSWGPCLEAILATDIHPWKVNRLVGYRAGEMLYKGEAWPVPVSDPAPPIPWENKVALELRTNPPGGADLGVRAIFDHLGRATSGAAVRGTDPRAQAIATRHVPKGAESGRTRNRTWQSWAPTGRPGVRAC